MPVREVKGKRLTLYQAFILRNGLHNISYYSSIKDIYDLCYSINTIDNYFRPRRIYFICG